MKDEIGHWKRFWDGVSLDDAIPHARRFQKCLENVLRDLEDYSELADLRLKIQVTYMAIALHGTILESGLLNKIGRVLANEVNSNTSNFEWNGVNRHNLNEFFPPECLELSQKLFDLEFVECNYKDPVIPNLLKLLEQERESYESLLQAAKEREIKNKKNEIVNTLTVPSVTTSMDYGSLSHIFQYADLEKPKPDKEIIDPQRQYEQDLKEIKQGEHKKIQKVEDGSAEFWKKKLMRPRDKLEAWKKEQIEIKERNNKRDSERINGPNNEQERSTQHSFPG